MAKKPQENAWNVISSMNWWKKRAEIPDEALGDQRLNSVLQGQKDGVEQNPRMRFLRAPCRLLGLRRRHYWRLSETVGALVPSFLLLPVSSPTFPWCVVQFISRSRESLFGFSFSALKDMTNGVVCGNRQQMQLGFLQDWVWAWDQRRVASHPLNASRQHWIMWKEYGIAKKKNGIRDLKLPVLCLIWWPFQLGRVLFFN